MLSNFSQAVDFEMEKRKMKSTSEQGSHKMETNRNNSMGAFLLGIGVGAAVALLLAPRSGEEIRRTLRESTDKSREALQQQGQQLGERAREVIDRGKEYIQWGRETVTSAVNAGKQVYRDKQQARNNPNGNPTS
jgi:gas vesicle protein